MTDVSAINDRPATYRYGDKDRRVLGVLTYPHQPRPGTLVGPNGWGEICVVLGPLPGGRTAIGLAIKPDMVAAAARIAEHGPESAADRTVFAAMGNAVTR
jgi:hypothetical protein